MHTWRIKNLSLQRRFFLLSFTIILVFSVAVTATAFLAQKNNLEQSLNNKGKGFARYVAAVSADALLLEDALQLDALVEEVRDEDVIYTVIEDEDGKALTTPFASLNRAHPQVRSHLQKFPPDLPVGAAITMLKKDDIIELSQPVRVDSSTQGTVRIGLSKERINEQLFRQTAIILAGMLIMSITLTISLNLATNRLVLRPVTELARVADELASGNMAARVTSSSVGEIQTVCLSFNEMAKRLEEDMTELRQAEAEVRFAQEAQEAILNSMPDLMFRTDLEGVIKEFHSSAVNLPYLPPTEFLGKRFHDVLPEGAARAIAAALQEAGETGFHRGAVYSLAMPQGETWFELSVTAMGNPCTGFILLVRDVTERTQMEKEQQRLEKQLLHAQKLESLGVLAGGIAHDFNNILMAIMGNAELAMLRLDEESPVMRNLRSIEQSSARAAELASQMLAYSGKGKFVIEDVDLNRVLQEMLQMLEVSVSKKAALSFDPAESLPFVEADATQVRQVVMNLIMNASEAIGEKGGTIKVSTGSMFCDRNYLKTVWNEELPEGKYVYLEVGDNGCGMDQETLARLFDPFFTTKFTGRGLGMAAVLGIVRGHKGAIIINSNPGNGTTVRVLIPSGEQQVQGEKHVPLPKGDAWKGAGEVLLVDDEENVLSTGCEMLRSLGFAPVTARDGREALEIYRNAPEIRLVILDLTMPAMDGEQCLGELKKMDPEVKIVISSGFSEYEVKKRFAGKEPAAFLQKPYSLSALREVLKGISPGT